MTSEGYYIPATGNYYYYLKDHLGNNRITYHYSGSAPVIDQEVEYYPFGSMFAANNLQNNLYLYNGKELNNEFFENYDYGARFYDPQIGRFTTLDPAAELGRGWSPYTYTFDNPMRFTDPDGMWPNTNALYGSIKKTLNEFAAVRSQYTNWSNAKVFGTTILNRAADLASYTDLNDAVIISTTITRGDNAVNIKGGNATNEDKIATGIGLALPLVSGSAAKKVIDNVGLTDELIKAADNLLGAIRKVGVDKVHGNSLSSDAEKFLYKKFDKDGNFLKWGKTQDLNTRYSNEQLRGGWLEEMDSGNAKEIHAKERNMVETDPGPENKEPWAGKRKMENE